MHTNLFEAFVDFIGINPMTARLILFTACAILLLVLFCAPLGVEAIKTMNSIKNGLDMFARSTR